MNYFFYINLFITWLLFWSFSSVIIYRLKSWESGILNGRSHCARCNHILWFLDLIPIVSWIKNLWKCKYCKDKISAIYPFLEISTWILFTLIWYFFIDLDLLIIWNINEIIKLIFWLIIWFITIIYSFYDILFLEIHDWVMLSWILLSIIFITLESLNIINIFTYLNTNTDILLNIISIFILSITIWLLYIIIFKELELKYDFLILLVIWTIIYLFLNLTGSNISDFIWINSSVWILIIFTFLFAQIAISGGAWMWGWDLRIAILLWILVWFTFSIETLFFTYIVWSIISIILVLFQKIRNWYKYKVNTQIPFWPFLALWFFITLFYQTPITEIMQVYL
jgi:prepilin signal peptidase PulO-like enzyme (type II secretory pathway)